MNPEHVEIVRQGKDAIAAWRRAHPYPERLDLSRADLTGANLTGADLGQADLTGANLTGADLGQANLAAANLVGAHLVRAHLVGANLRVAKLAAANLEDADLKQAHLEYADLTRANLTGAALAGASLTRTNLVEANLARADLAGASLMGASLTGASLTRAILMGANLAGANLTRSNLEETSLVRASLLGASLAGVVFRQTRLEGARFFAAAFDATILADCDLSPALGLEEALHYSPSTIGLDTFVRSGGNIPDMFLRGCGYDPIIQRIIHGDSAEKTDAFYEWLGQGGGPLRFESCFISYTSEDKAFADRLQKGLNDQRIDYWYAPEHGRWGEELTTQIDREIKVRDRLILVCSEASLNNSDWVRWEIDRAIEREKERNTRVIFPVMIDDTLLKWNHPRANRIREVLAADFRRATRGQAFEAALARLIEGLRAS